MLHHFHAVLLQANSVKFTVFIVDLVDHIQCTDVRKAYHGIFKDFNICGFHIILNMEFQVSVVCVFYCCKICRNLSKQLLI